MSFKSKLSVGGKELTILDCSYELFQEIDVTGRPSSVTRGGTIDLTIESTGDSFFFEWMTDNFDRKDGTIMYVKRDTDAKLKELKFEEAYLVRYKEHFNASGTSPLTERFTISAKQITVGNGTIKNEWV